MHAEREERVRQLEGDIIDINEIMRDLSSMVVEQGQMIGESKKNLLVSLLYVALLYVLLKFVPIFVN